MFGFTFSGGVYTATVGGLMRLTGFGVLADDDSGTSLQIGFLRNGTDLLSAAFGFRPAGTGLLLLAHTVDTIVDVLIGDTFEPAYSTDTADAAATVQVATLQMTRGI